MCSVAIVPMLNNQLVLDSVVLAEDKAGKTRDDGRKRRNKSARAREAKRLKALVSSGISDWTCAEADVAAGDASARAADEAANEGGQALPPDDELARRPDRRASLAAAPGAAGWYDRVLVDADCSHDGSVKHLRKLSAAELSLRLCPSLCAAHVRTQRALLRNGFRVLRPGGVLVYATCSLTRAQNEEVVAWLLAQEPGAVIDPSWALSALPFSAGADKLVGANCGPHVHVDASAEAAQACSSTCAQAGAAAEVGTVESEVEAGSAAATLLVQESSLCVDAARGQTGSKEEASEVSFAPSGGAIPWVVGGLPGTIRFSPRLGTSGLFICRLTKQG